MIIEFKFNIDFIDLNVGRAYCLRRSATTDQERKGFRRIGPKLV